MEILMPLIFIFLALFIYFLPSFISAGKKQCNSVLVINLFLGWTLVGWVAALALATFPMEESK